MKKYAVIIFAGIILAVAGSLYYLNYTKERSANVVEQSSSEETRKDARESVWAQMSAQQKDEIDGTWSDGKIAKVTLSESSVMSTVGEKNYAGKEVYIVSFPSKLAATLGDVMVYADVNTLDIIGYGLRD